MNALDLAKTAYASNTAPLRTQRSAEFDAFARVTSRLRNADPQRHYADFVGALHENRQLWTILAADVADPANGLPQDLRARIFYLAEYTREHTSRVLNGHAAPDALVEINAAVMRGLSNRAQTT